MASPALYLTMSTCATPGQSIFPVLGITRAVPAWRRLFSSSSSSPFPTPTTTMARIQPSTVFVFSPSAMGVFFNIRFLRPFSPASSFTSSCRPTPFAVSRPVLSLSARYYQNGVSRTILARAEANANRNPQSPSSQSVFYSMLLAANMPQIVVERYNSGHFARNESCDDVFRRAMSMLHTPPPVPPAPPLPAQAAAPQPMPTPSPPDPNYAATTTGYSPAQLQAAGQAVTAHTQGSNIAVSPGPYGASQGPLHVRIDETIGSLVFKWVKFVAWFCFFAYLSFIVVTMIIDSFSLMPKRSGNRGQPEVKAENQKARFSDVHGCDEAKEELQDLVEFLKNPDKFNTLGGKLPKGVLLVGPPGTGKTLLARAVAGEAGVPFFYMSGSEFDEVYVGVGAKRVRDLFAGAKAKSPAIVFIDELDAIGGRRNSRDAAYVKQTLNQLLTELDGFEQNSGVIILAATNFPELLDKALTRPGRFDRHVVVGLPDARGRIAILKHHASKIKAAKDVDIEGIALTTSGLSGAELENIVNEAAVHASKNQAKEVTKKDFEWAKDKVIMGAERKTMVIDPKQKEMTAYHEAGHALLRWYTNPKTLHKVTILPRGMTLGHMAFRPEMDKHNHTASDYEQLILVAYGGYAAEELVYGSSKTTDGVSSDIQQATKIAFQMVAMFGMSKDFGPVEFVHMYNHLSAQTKASIESAVREKLMGAYDKAKRMLTDNRKDLDTLAQALLKYETLDREEVGKVLKGEDLPNRIPVPPGPLIVHPGNRPEPDSIPGDGESSAPPPPLAASPQESSDQ